MRTQVILYIVILVSSLHAITVALADSYEDLRVSSNSFNGNYHSITPDRAYKSTRRTDVINQLGKPLVAISPPVAPRPTAQPAQRQRQTKRPPLKQINRQAVPPKWVQPALVSPQLSPFDAATVASSAQNVCRWVSLRELSSVSYDTGEVVIRDASDQPCYIITMRALIKWNEDAYFPLRRYRLPAHNAYKIEYNEPSELLNSSGPQRLLLNCSLPPESASKGISTVALMSGQRANRAFNEEITIQVSCGFLVLQLRGDGTYLSLETISFYQVRSVTLDDVDGTGLGAFSSSASASIVARTASNAAQQAANPSSPTGTVAANSRHLVFTTEGQPDISPLIVMPTFSRYICQHDIVLTGNNSVQLVVLRFELKRLANEPVVPLDGETAGGGGGGSSVQQQQQQQEMRYTGRDTFADTRPRRDAHDTTILYKNPMTAVTRCSNPTTPGVPLKSMMEGSNSLGNDTMTGGQLANRLVASGSSSLAPTGAFLNLIALGLVAILNMSFSMRLLV